MKEKNGSKKVKSSSKRSSVSKGKLIPLRIEEQTFGQDSRTIGQEEDFTALKCDRTRSEGFYYSERREPTEDEIRRDDSPDRIEAHRILMEETEKQLVKRSPVQESKDKAQERAQSSMLQISSVALDENAIINRYLSPQSSDPNNSAMLFLAGTLFSSNKYIFELLNENGFFNSSSERLITSLATEFITRGNQLSKALLEAERASGEAIRNLVVSCVNNFVSTSDQLVKVLEESYERKTGSGNATIAPARDVSTSQLTNVIAKRNYISSALYDFFQRAVEMQQPALTASQAQEKKIDNSTGSTSETSAACISREVGDTVRYLAEKEKQVEESIAASSARSVACVSKEVGDTVQFLADAEQFTGILYGGINAKRQACGSNDCTKIQCVPNHRGIIPAKENASKKTATTEKSSSASPSSFLDFFDASRLSGMFYPNSNEDQILDPEPTTSNHREMLLPQNNSIDNADVMSTASSFLDFINGASLSKMLEEDEQSGFLLRDGGLPEEHLDAIFERMNLSIPKEKTIADDASMLTLQSRWGWNQGKKQKSSSPRLTGREKRRQMIKARSWARHEKKQKNLGKKKAARRNSKKSEKDKKTSGRKQTPRKSKEDLRNRKLQYLAEF